MNLYDNLLSGNTPLALYIIIECVANFPGAMSRGITIIRMIPKSFALILYHHLVLH